MTLLQILPYDFLRPLILPLDEINAHVPKNAKVVDLGCGQGVMVKFLAKEKTRDVVGVDLDATRIPQTKYQNLNFINRDIRKFDVSEFNTVIMSDGLHHLNLDDQKKTLNNIAESLKKGSLLIIKEIDTDEFIRSRLSRLWDFILYPKDKIYFWPAQKLKSTLEGLGFSVKITRPCRLFPGSTTLLICTKK